MKILIAGGYNYFTESLLSRLQREKESTYIVCGKDSRQKSVSKAVQYNLDVSDRIVTKIIDDIHPDAIVFAGAFDSLYRWDSSNNTITDYLNSLSNMLNLSYNHHVRHFIYVSSSEFDEKNSTSLSQKELAIKEGENLCRSFHEKGLVKVTILRFDPLFGIPTNKDESCGKLGDFVYNVFKSNKTYTGHDQIKPVFVSDAVDAIYKTLISKTIDKLEYNIKSKWQVNLLALSECIIELDLKTKKLVSADQLSDRFFQPLEYEQTADFSVFVAPNRAVFNLLSTFINKHWYEDGAIYQGRFRRVINSVKQTTGQIGSIISRIMPFLENVGLFLLIHLCFYFQYPEPYQLYVLYIILISILFGRSQMYIAIIASVLSFTFISSTESSLLAIVSNYRYVFSVLNMIIAGFCISFVRDKMSYAIKTKDERNNDQAKEIDELNDVLATSRDINRELESRLLNHNDSLSAIYEIVARLDALETSKVFSGALDVVSSIMRSNDVSIYISSVNSQFFRIVAGSSQMAKDSMPASIRMGDYQLFFDKLRDEGIFVNNNLSPNLPIMAIPVSTGDSSSVIIMLWSIEFKDLSLYHANLFMVLRMIITNAISRAFRHEVSTRSIRYIDDTEILAPEYFSEFLADQRKLSKDSVVPYQLLRVSGEHDNLHQLSISLTKVLRTTDNIGVDKNGCVIVFLAATAVSDLDLVMQRLRNNGVDTTVVSKDEEETLCTSS